MSGKKHLTATSEFTNHVLQFMNDFDYEAFEYGEPLELKNKNGCTAEQLDTLKANLPDTRVI